MLDLLLRLAVVWLVKIWYGLKVYVLPNGWWNTTYEKMYDCE